MKHTVPPEVICTSGLVNKLRETQASFMKSKMLGNSSSETQGQLVGARGNKSDASFLCLIYFLSPQLTAPGSPRMLGNSDLSRKEHFFGKLHSSHRTSAFVNPLVRDKFFTPIVYFNWPVIQTKPVKCSWGRYLAVICGWLWSMFKVPFRGFHWNQNSIFAEKGFRGWGGGAGGFYYISHFVFI